jgi:ubiquinone/menaquinone biosynthesis C-methylase UbiE
MDKAVTVDKENEAYPGQAGYTPRLLRFYDIWVMYHTMPVLWRCRKKYLLRHYKENAGARHLDIGVATGYLIDKCQFPVETPAITLMDLNPNSLEYASRRIRRYSPTTHQANVLQPWGLPEHSFDSIAMFNLLHCLPGTLREKAPRAFEHAPAVLAPGGTLFGVTVLGTEADHTRSSIKMMERLNRGGNFCNLDDRCEDLEAALSEHFPSYEVEVRGAMALFSAQAGN